MSPFFSTRRQACNRDERDSIEYEPEPRQLPVPALGPLALKISAGTFSGFIVSFGCLNAIILPGCSVGPALLNTHCQRIQDGRSIAGRCGTRHHHRFRSRHFDGHRPGPACNSRSLARAGSVVEESAVTAASSVDSRLERIIGLDSGSNKTEIDLICPWMPSRFPVRAPLRHRRR